MLCNVNIKNKGAYYQKNGVYFEDVPKVFPLCFLLEWGFKHQMFFAELKLSYHTFLNYFKNSYLYINT